ncbi:O-methyltransferase [Natronorubrum sp. FCH18a]|uniref:O-methyltransferase n=1 Tax=Natronorubrum sp. FCH18a TaxID=3447018 RepID=UPI003F510CD3
MVDVLSDEIARFVRAVGPEPDETLREMDDYAEREGFPHVGPEVGAFLRFVARMADAERIFEFGSGYGYSAYWMAEALPTDGEIVLTEVDEDELELAREYMDAGGYDDLARYELGDAMETVEAYDGPFDVVLIDHQKHRYADALEAVRSKVPVGGVVIADNALTSSSIEFETLLAIVESETRAKHGSRSSERGGTPREQGREPDEVNDHTQGIADYLERVTDDPDFETIVLPLGEGIAASYRVR